MELTWAGNTVVGSGRVTKHFANIFCVFGLRFTAREAREVAKS